jgi:hypothetical protein
MTEQERFIERMSAISHRIDKDEKVSVKILGKEYKISDTKRWVLDKIMNIAYDVNYKKSKSGNFKKNLKKIQTSDVRVASYIILNSWSYIPFVHAIHWRYLRMSKTAEVFNGVIEMALNNPENDFFLKSLLRLSNLLVSRTQMIQVQEQ